jgi:hypothetical protein
MYGREKSDVAGGGRYQVSLVQEGRKEEKAELGARGKWVENASNASASKNK